MNPDLTIPSRIAVVLMLKQKLANWESSRQSSPWEQAAILYWDHLMGSCLLFLLTEKHDLR